MEIAKVSPGHDFYTVNTEEKQRTCVSAHGRRATGEKNDVKRDARVGKGRTNSADSLEMTAEWTPNASRADMAAAAGDVPVSAHTPPFQPEVTL